ncbi:hypothetical protein NDU88_003101 [Pleurodeles waltl]|uniref:Uncharacterized protein n=1 Tax=Pleurodeles waltl TaxID=8319 RepID=A0AAV7VCF5_PLEWA|nr:hypothetical protein NDU88_003101 [Pleurodeles waltl]
MVERGAGPALRKPHPVGLLPRESAGAAGPPRAFCGSTEGEDHFLRAPSPAGWEAQTGGSVNCLLPLRRRWPHLACSWCSDGAPTDGHANAVPVHTERILFLL